MEFLFISVEVVQLFELHENEAKGNRRNFEEGLIVMIGVRCL